MPRKTLTDRFFPGSTPPAKKSLPFSYSAEESLLQLELFSAHQMDQHGRILAQTHKISSASASNRLLERLAENEALISSACNLLIKAVQDNTQVTPAAEWLLDNFYLVEEQIRTAKRHFPKNYSEGLPRLVNGPSAGLPRVYDIALNIIAHSDAHLDPDILKVFITAYQETMPLNLGELWAIPIMLRLALIENLRRVATRTTASHVNRTLANEWADRMIKVADDDAAKLILVIADMARSEPPLDSAFIAELVRRLQGQGPSMTLPLSWIEQHLAQAGVTSEQMIQTEIQQQAANQVSISNSIGSLRFLGSMNWRDFVESISIVEHTLRQDPTGVYANMEFTTRDDYRHIVEKIAKSSALSENEVAQIALELAQDAAREKQSERYTHIGYYLVDRGVKKLEKLTKVRYGFWKTLARYLRHSLPVYLGSILVISAIVTYQLMTHDGTFPERPFWWLGAMVVFAFISSSHFAVSLTNWLSTLLAKPAHLPRMNYADGVPDNARTMVAVPALFTTTEHIDELTQSLEIRYLANRDANIFFCLLSDFRDAPTEHMPQDEILIERATKNIQALNDAYADGQQNRFFLFHRPRVWNAQEEVWMAHERKRGKLGDLNAFLLHGKCDSFSHIIGDTDVLTNITYVITLDEDTQLPPDAAWKLAATMAHPLNKPHYDDRLQRITAGYGILQPRVTNSLPGNNQSHFAHMFGGEPGIDPYTRAVSDVYQDAFHEGSFIGKGIYDVAAFETVLHNRFPDNKILSHDLLEGNYTRSGLVSDVQLYEEYPARYMADARRRHRWIRGDWQIAGWLRANVALGNGEKGKNPLSALSLWKIFDNLRRSMIPASLLALLLYGWLCSPTPGFWTLAITGILLTPPFLASIFNLLLKSKDVSLRQHLATGLYNTGRNIMISGFTLVTLPYEAFYTADAILRVWWRMLVSKRHLLEWNPSTVTNQQGSDLASLYRIMWFAPLLSLILIPLLSIHALNVALPFLAVWFVAPTIAWFISQPIRDKQAKLSNDQVVYLGSMARKIWAFFQTYVGPEDNWLPPDNAQEYPVDVVAHRTSPTNIGMSLLANLTAYDFGYLSLSQLMFRTGNTLDTMDKLERYKGHFYNWYDTETLQPLHPIYISTVDSGNLAGHLLVLKAGLLALDHEPVISPRLFQGFADTLNVIKSMTQGQSVPSMDTCHQLTESALQNPPVTLSETKVWLEQIKSNAQQLCSNHDDMLESDLSWWMKALQQQAQDALDVLHTLTPWVELAGNAQYAASVPSLDHIPTLQELISYGDTLLPAIRHAHQTAESPEHAAWLENVAHSIPQASAQAAIHLATLVSLAQRAGAMAWMEYEFLYNKDKHLLTIGYNLSDRRRDDSYYDLLASEARLANFVAIAQGQLPQESWFALGRQLTSAGGKQPILLSWSGSMFEYLMPLLVMPNFNKTLLDQTYRSTLQRQIDYGDQRNVPWGISESGYYQFDARLNYQYRAFGVPGLGLKRGLANDLVIAPYASVMGLMVMPEESCRNMQRMSKEGFEGKFGLYEAVDYTPSRVPRGKSHAIIRSFMAHHQGMSLLSISYLLLNKPMQKRFELDPFFQANMLLLHEKIPKATAFYSNNSELAIIRTAASTPFESAVRYFDTPNTTMPEVQLLSNGRYHVMVNNAGASSSRWKEFDVTRWREDATADQFGTFCYVRDLETNTSWSTTYQPTLKQPKFYEAIFTEGRAEFKRRDQNIDLHTEIVVSPEDDIELRRTRITNRSRKPRTIDITSYAEIVMAPHAADAAHPAFSNLFVQTEILEQQHAILATRRPRSVDEHPPWMFHLMTVHGLRPDAVSYETSRMNFVGRGHTLNQPQALVETSPLSGSQGSVLDPIASIRHQITLQPEQTVTFDIVTGASETRETCLTLVDKYRDHHLADRVFELAWTHSHVVLRQLNATETDAQLYSRMASSILYANPVLRADANVLVKNRRGQSGLWSYAISGDLPIVLVQIRDSQNIDLVRQMLQAHAYWRLKGLMVDLVIWNEDQAVYRQSLHEQILGLIAAGTEAQSVDRPGGIFVRSSDHIPLEDRILMESVARLIVSDTKGSLLEQINRPQLGGLRVPRLLPKDMLSQPQPPKAVEAQRDLMLFNGTGGFSADGREYVITTQPGQRTPTPWSNVLANPYFGTVISESGQSYTWHENAHAFRLTPWHNDPVIDQSGEAFYVRDEDTGDYWSPMPRPTHSSQPYTTRHGFGYSVFEHTENGIQTEMTVYVAIDAPIKFSVLKVRNASGRSRKLSATGYVEWVMGDQREKTSMHVISEVDPHTGALLARNAYNTQFAERTAFFDTDDSNRTMTCDRRDFIGRNKNLGNPAALRRTHLSGKVGAGLDPCAALQVPFTLEDGEEHEIIFRMGVTDKHGADVYRFIQRYRGGFAARSALTAVQQHWDDALSTIQIETPDPALNVLTNGWLMYQTLACRLWARSGYYQSGGAFGFRDQLQDTMAVVHTKPQLMREHLLLCASHQFVEGDVQHWWHPPSDRGVRTRCSDDYLWLALATCHYVNSTGDTGVLDEVVPFIEGRLLNPGEESYYDLPTRSAESATLYEHCVRALRYGMKFGSHGLPLIGSCDWNDGMDRVGLHGQGESVWLGFFLYDILLRFRPIAQLKQDDIFADLCVSQAEQLRQNIEDNAWDGGWYRRAYFDDGTPLGSAANVDCQIDSLSQSWSVLSGAGDAERSRMGMEAVNQRLVRRDHGLIQLLDPPFDKGELNPGYIRGYVPGVRENGGQYTHAAIWTAMAFAKLGDRDRTWELLQMINPLNHAKTPEDVATYKVEPYVIAADIYAVSPHSGRGGWTWYTGSSGWMYRLIVESFLGLHLQVDHLTFNPCLPKHWPGFKLQYRFYHTTYTIHVTQTPAVTEQIITVDGIKQDGSTIRLINDEETHLVDIQLPA